MMASLYFLLLAFEKKDYKKKILYGTLAGIMRNTPFGEIFTIERKIPPSYVLDLFLVGLGIKNLAELRFSIAKTLKIGEGEVFLPENLWNLNNHERLLISPHEILFETWYYR